MAVNRSKIKRWYGAEAENRPKKTRTREEYQDMLERRMSWHEKKMTQKSECLVEFPWTFVADRPRVRTPDEDGRLHNLRLKVTHKGRYRNWSGDEYQPVLMVDADGYVYRWIATARARSKVREVEVGDILVIPQCAVKELLPDQGLTCIFYLSKWSIIPPSRQITI